jgi:hypothetical protein
LENVEIPRITIETVDINPSPEKVELDNKMNAVDVFMNKSPS